MLQMEDGALWQLSETVRPAAHPMARSWGGSPPLADNGRTVTLRQRFLAVQQSQLREDAKLPDPAEAYRVLVKELQAA